VDRAGVCMDTMIRTEQTTRSPRRILQLFNWPVLGTCSHDWPVVSTKRTLFCFNMHNKKIRQHWWLHGDEPTIRPHRCSSSAPHRKQCNLKHSSTLLSPGYVVAEDRPARAGIFFRIQLQPLAIDWAKKGIHACNAIY
jgi:hypothetical protein